MRMIIQGNGFLLLGTVVDVRNQTIHDSSKHHRYVAVVVDVEMVRNRKFDASGNEMELNFQTEKIQSKGYINKYGISCCKHLICQITKNWMIQNEFLPINSVQRLVELFHRVTAINNCRNSILTSRIG